MSSIYLHQALGFFSTLLKIFSSKAAIKSIAYGGANLVRIAVPQICLLVLSENSKMLFFNTIQWVLSKCLLWPVCQPYCPENPLKKQGLHHIYIYKIYIYFFTYEQVLALCCSHLSFVCLTLVLFERDTLFFWIQCSMFFTILFILLSKYNNSSTQGGHFLVFNIWIMIYIASKSTFCL